MDKKQKIIVTGSNGLLGNRLVKSLSKNYDVFAIAHRPPEKPIEGVFYKTIDFSNNCWLGDDLPSDVDTIFHLAQSSKFRDFPDEAMDIFNVNINSTARLLDFAKKNGVRKFVYASSGGVYGSGGNAFHENSPIQPRGTLGYYLGSKLCSEILCENYASHMSINIVRFFFMYGPEQKKSMLIPRMVESVKTGQAISLQGNNGISINPIHVSDSVRALQKIITVPESRTFNIAGTEVYSLRDIAEMVGKILGKSPVFTSIPGEENNIVASIEEMKSVLVKPAISLQQGLVEIAEAP